MKDYTRNTYRSSSRGSGTGRFRLKGLFQWLQGVVGPVSASWSPRTVLFSLLVITLGGLLTFQVVWQQSRVSRMKHQVAQLQQERMEIRDRIRTEETKVARLQSLDRIGHLAVHELGMRPGLDPQVVEVKQTRRVELPFDPRTDASSP